MVPDFAKYVIIQAWLDFDFYPLVTFTDGMVDFLQQVTHGRLDADADADINLFPGAAERFGKGHVFPFGVKVPDGSFQRGFGHIITLDWLEYVAYFLRVVDVVFPQQLH